MATKSDSFMKAISKLPAPTAKKVTARSPLVSREKTTSKEGSKKLPKDGETPKRSFRKKKDEDSGLPPKPWMFISSKEDGNGSVEYPECEDFEPNFSSSAYDQLKEEKVTKLTTPSLQKLRKWCKGKLSSLVFRKVRRVSFATEGTMRYVYHSPEHHEEISEETYNELDGVKKVDRVEKFFEGTYSFVTFPLPAFPFRDAFKDQVIYGKNTGRCVFDPVNLSLVLVKSEGQHVPGVCSKDWDDPSSLVCGIVSKNKFTGKLEYTKWFVSSHQEMFAILTMIDPEKPLPRKGATEKYDPYVYRVWLMGGGRLVTNTFRRRVLSELADKTPLSEEKKEEIYIRYMGSDWGLRHCHILSCWVLMVKYGELPANGNIPTTIWELRPKDPELLKKYYRAKPMKWWDLPRTTFDQEGQIKPLYSSTTKTPKKGKKGKKDRSIRLDEIIVKNLELETYETISKIPVHPRTAWPDDFMTPPPLSEQPGKNDIAELVVSFANSDSDFSEGSQKDENPSRAESVDLSASIPLDRSTGSGSDSDTDSNTIGLGSSDPGLSSDSESEARSQTPPVLEVVPEVQETKTWLFKSWGDRVEGEEDEEMDYSAPLVFSTD